MSQKWGDLRHAKPTIYHFPEKNRIGTPSLDVFKKDAFHDLLTDEFNEYALVGGMPEALVAYLYTGSYAAIREIYDSRFLGYIDDILTQAASRNLS